MIVHARKRGKGLVNSIINNLPVELHIPGYQYCGPGTRLVKRLARGDPGINPLDAACKEHDIAYSRNRENLAARSDADKILADRAWSRVFAKDASLGEKAAAWAVANAMKVKTKLGMGLRRRRKTTLGMGLRRKTKPGVRAKKTERLRKRKLGMTKKPLTALRRIVDAAKQSMQVNGDTHAAVKSALRGARDAVKRAGDRASVHSPRILPVPAKIGGFLPFLVPLFAGLSATGALAGGATGIVKTVNDASAAKRQLEESTRHNRTMEAIALGKGLYLKPHRKGLGLHLKPYPKN